MDTSLYLNWSRGPAFYLLVLLCSLMFPFSVAENADVEVGAYPLHLAAKRGRVPVLEVAFLGTPRCGRTVEGCDDGPYLSPQHWCFCWTFRVLGPENPENFGMSGCFWEERGFVNAPFKG